MGEPHGTVWRELKCQAEEESKDTFILVAIVEDMPKHTTLILFISDLTYIAIFAVIGFSNQLLF